jgi:hypothetical protein
MAGRLEVLRYIGYGKAALLIIGARIKVWSAEPCSQSPSHITRLPESTFVQTDILHPPGEFANVAGALRALGGAAISFRVWNPVH